MQIVIISMFAGAATALVFSIIWTVVGKQFRSNPFLPPIVGAIAAFILTHHLGWTAIGLVGGFMGYVIEDIIVGFLRDIFHQKSA